MRYQEHLIGTMATIIRNVKIHSCRIRPEGIPRDLLVPGERYIGELNKNIENQSWCYSLPKSCRCRKFASSREVTEAVAVGQAVWILKLKKGAVIPDENQAWMAIERVKVPRVDLVSRADIERSVIGSERKSRHFMYNRILQKYVRVNVIPEGLTKAEWDKEALDEIKFEKRIKSQYSLYIELIHDLYMDNRKKLIVPFREDPFKGRTLFAFAPDQRTVGGHE